ncbi:MAG: DUF6893 family small protein [Candidatus Binataceae bacterium]
MLAVEIIGAIVAAIILLLIAISIPDITRYVHISRM